MSHAFHDPLLQKDTALPLYHPFNTSTQLSDTNTTDRITHN